MKKNAPLLLGGIILFAILSLIVFPDRFTHLNPYGTQGVESWVENEQFMMSAPPFAPGQGSPLGTDDQGRDVLSLIIYGTKLTMLMSVLVVLGRYLVAIPLGLLAGFGSYVAKTILSQFNVIFSAIPALIFSIIFLKMDFLTEKILTESKAQGVLIVVAPGENLPESFGSELYSGVKVWLNPASADLITGKNLTVTLESEKLGNTGKNIIGVLPGTDSKAGKEAIVLGIGYNYLPEDQEMGKQRIQFGLELAKKLSAENHNRQLILCFWDGTLSDSFHGVKAFAANPILSPQDIQLYVDLTQISTSQGDFVYFNVEQAPATRSFVFSFGHQLQKNLNDNHLEVRTYASIRRTEDILYYGASPEETMFYKGSIATVIVGLGQEKQAGKISLNDLGSVVWDTIRKNSY